MRSLTLGMGRCENALGEHAQPCDSTLENLQRILQPKTLGPGVIFLLRRRDERGLER